jgi:hypothetical protein
VSRAIKNPFRSAYRSFVSPIARGVIKAARRDFEAAIIVPLEGSLGLKMWRYAVGCAAGIASGLPVRHDVSLIDDDASDPDFMEGVFPEIALQKAPGAITRLYQRYFFTSDPDGDPMAYDETILSSKRPRYMGGSYLNAAYIEGHEIALREKFAFRPVLTEESRFIFSSIYMEELPVAVHLAPGIVSGRYFRAAVRLMSERLAPAKPVFFVFSRDDEPDADILSDTGEEFVYVDEDQGGEAARMYLMSRCKHFIISNSLSGWWPALLSQETPDKIVMLPDKWLGESRHDAAGAMSRHGWVILPY